MHLFQFMIIVKFDASSFFLPTNTLTDRIVGPTNLIAVCKIGVHLIRWK